VKRHLANTIREALIVTIVAAVVGIGVNAVRDDGIPLVASPEDFSVSTKAELMRIQDAKKLFDEGAAVFVDARSAEVFSRKHIEGAINIEPAGNLDDFSWLTKADAYIIAYASRETQRQAGVVADRLIDIGCSKVYVLRGGLEAWLEAGLPTGEQEN